MCRLLGISPQAYYKREKRKKQRSQELDMVKSLVIDKRIIQPRLGTRKLYYLLSDEIKAKGIKLGRDGLFTLLRQEHMLVKKKKSYTKTTNSRHWMHKHDNYYKDMEILSPDQAWVSDITYLRTKSGFCYLSLITDAFSRKIMGYNVSLSLDSEGCINALKMALKGKKSSFNPLHHSDKGLQYCSTDYQEILASNNMKCSMTSGYDCYQNALAERVNGILKDELLPDLFENSKQAKQIVKQSIYIYNNFRPHLSLNMETPNNVYKKISEHQSTNFCNFVV